MKKQTLTSHCLKNKLNYNLCKESFIPNTGNGLTKILLFTFIFVSREQRFGKEEKKGSAV